MCFPAKIILASTSPRRRELLAEAGYKFSVVAPDVNEPDYPADRSSPSEYAKCLALAKAKSVADNYPDRLVIGGDTVVDFNGQIIGKPTDAKDAQQITKKLFSCTHKVVTAIAVLRLSDNTEITATETTIIYPKKVTSQQIAAHIKGQSWRNKAGAYAIREDGDEFIERIDGSLTNVMGMPMELLEQLLSTVRL